MKKVIQLIGLVVAALGPMSFAQSPATPPTSPNAPVQAKRIPSQPSFPQPPLIQKYDFGEQLRLLEDPTAMSAQKTLPSPPWVM